MIRSFKNKGTEDVFNGRRTKAARQLCSQGLLSLVRRKLDQVDSAGQIQDLRIPPGNRLEALRGRRAGQYSIRINQQYRICFLWTESGPSEVEIVDYH